MKPIYLKRIYDAPDIADGKRILVDRIWPRGMSKERAGLALWMKEIAPSRELRIWFGHDPGKFAEFRKRYRQELDGDPEKRQLVRQLRSWAETETITLVYAAKDAAHNQAVVLRDRIAEETAL
ncbi:MULTISPECIES: DUF488 domain-containing protein [unclassified Paenibacillus]|uniref:DUF488 domain-containing protein n=1 Tax=unclassified Paenibacillus TaxID=185978 RepID=UPI001C0FB56F|nr:MULTISPECIES: DUF488 family protein [unclassified Paenibacillus]MBU5442274.1 DUF488 family protein [Paenibacillus sp. MSJ-34]CAH0121814.1 hypothetical protein PAE9249_04348 [Paenibacillus sp. CECT 9249]